MADDIRISDDPAELDRDRVFQWISGESYWAKGVSRKKQETAIDNSWCFGAYDAASGEQIGFARVVTDRATFAWLCDVFVDESARARSVGKALVTAIVAALDAVGVTRTMLATADAHGLYARYGFAPVEDATRWMERKP